ncbi:MAG: hypothetical protein F6K24_46635 [Okeania sp. SIO2D1]|nr:hypothetical protein [Okeania sp. SIO2D1]
MKVSSSHRRNYFTPGTRRSRSSLTGQTCLKYFIQDGLGTAYSRRFAKTGNSEDRQRAIAAYQKSLQVEELKNNPVEWAITKTNLGNIYLCCPEDYQLAVTCHLLGRIYRQWHLTN